MDRAEGAGLEVRGVRLKVAPTETPPRYRVPGSVELVTDLRELPDLDGLAAIEGPDVPPEPRRDEWAILSSPLFGSLRHQMRPYNMFAHLQPGAWLKWRTLYVGDDVQMSPQPEGCVFAFAALADAPDSEVRDFAARWGPLGICMCDRPSGHMLFHTPRGFSFDASGLHCPLRFGWEPINIWRRYAREAAVIIRLAAASATGKPLADADLLGLRQAMIDPPPPAEFLRVARIVPGRVQMQMASVVDRWLTEGSVTMRFRYRTRRGKSGWGAELEISEGYLHGLAGYGFLPGVLAMQLATVLTSRNGLYDCSNCGHEYMPLDRKPKQGQNTFCYGCRRGDRGAKRVNAQKVRAGARG